MGLYKDVEKLGGRETVYTPGLGYTPVILKEARVLSESSIKLVKKYVGGPVPSKVYVFAADPDYLEALKKSGYTVKPYTEDELYGRVEGVYIVCRGSDGPCAVYPPLDHYSGPGEAIWIHEAVADRIPAIVYEATRYAIDTLGMKDLERVRDVVAELNGILAASKAPPVPLGRLVSALNDSRVVAELEKLVDPEVQRQVNAIYEYHGVSENLALLSTIVGMIKNGEVHPMNVAGILRGERCVEIHGYLLIFKDCSSDT